MGGAGAESLISVAVEAAAPVDPAIMSVSKYDFSILKIRPQLRELENNPLGSRESLPCICLVWKR